jgi:hypothetical protein
MWAKFDGFNFQQFTGNESGIGSIMCFHVLKLMDKNLLGVVMGEKKMHFWIKYPGHENFYQ